MAWGEETFGSYTGFLLQESDNVSEEVETCAKTFKVVEGDYNIGVFGDNYEYLFSRVFSSILSLKRDGKEVLSGVPMPVYTRAFTDNDKGNGLDFDSALFKLASSSQKACKVNVEHDDKKVKIEYSYKIAAFAETIVKVAYEVSDDGVIGVTMNYPGFKDAPLLPEFGLSIPVVKDYNSFTYYGLGPEENYIDRNNGVKLGIYENKVTNMLTEYARPQECGNRSGVRKLSILDGGEKLISIEMEDKPFEFSFLPNSTEELDAALHIDELPKSRHNTLKILYKQMGVGGDDSWGAPVHKEYQIKGDESIEFKFKIVLS